MKKIRQFVHNWMLVIGMIGGAGLYLAYHSLDFLHPAGPFLLKACRSVQPWLLFAMLFLSFCKIEPRQLRPRKWMLELLAVQGGVFAVICLLLMWARASCGVSGIASFIFANRLFLESFLLCMICPTATACAVVTGKLGGSMAGAVCYTVLINLLVAFMVPLFVPLIYPQEGMTFTTAFIKIMAKVFPLLIMPCIAAWLVRRFLPGLHELLLKYVHWSFYIWAMALTLAILMSTRALVGSGASLTVLGRIAIATLVSCILQFATGKAIGRKQGAHITAGQSLGQKNTVFAIWMGYTFMDPVVSIAGGFYSIFHNCYNTYQLHKAADGKDRN